jgi:Biotin-lipoyl like/HlyD family secretion protein
MNAPLNISGSSASVTASQAASALSTAATSNATITAFADLEERARQAKSVQELIFIITNETFGLLPYRQAVLWELDAGKRTKLRLVSGLTKLTDDSPNTIYLKRLGKEIAGRLGADGEYFVSTDFKTKLAGEWGDWMPDYFLCFFIKGPNATDLPRALIGFALENEATELQQDWLIRLLGSYGHAWGALSGARKKVSSGWWRNRLLWGSAFILTLLAMFVPVRLSVLAPAEVISFDAIAVSAPMDGVVKEFKVTPSQMVKKGDVLLTLEDTTLKSRRDVALKQLAVAKADSLAAAQRSFASEQSRGEMAALNGRVAEREAEITAIDDMLARVEVRAARDGIAVFGDVNDWQGKPVVTGERIAQLADPKDSGMLIWLPVSDAINLDAGAEVKVYLQVAPLQPLTAKVVQTSYQVSLAPDGVASYRLRARFEGLNESDLKLARVGLKGTAKIYGEKAPLGYYLFRRPLATLREISGF